jgi:hypothetical protein
VRPNWGQPLKLNRTSGQQNRLYETPSVFEIVALILRALPFSATLILTLNNSRLYEELPGIRH